MEFPRPQDRQRSALYKMRASRRDLTEVDSSGISMSAHFNPRARFPRKNLKMRRNSSGLVQDLRRAGVSLRKRDRGRSVCLVSRRREAKPMWATRREELAG